MRRRRRAARAATARRQQRRPRQPGVRHRVPEHHLRTVHRGKPMKKVLILGVNGFIGHHLTRRILETTPWEVYGMDMSSDRLGDLVNH
ncbi:NAD-dependent epimerase/dehydratase family protein, partial [Cupriavidus pauculus]|uniref:NAD-dependent epimerase/dehydratase family protein n=1 Tax=Cupriavidus pauculus TaxID=82633 RepID=UPI00390888D8